MGCGSSTPQAESPAHVPAVTVIDATKPGNGIEVVRSSDPQLATTEQEGGSRRGSAAVTSEGNGAHDGKPTTPEASPPSCSQNGGDGHQNGHKGEDGHHHHQRLKSHLAMAREGDASDHLRNSKAVTQMNEEIEREASKDSQHIASAFAQRLEGPAAPHEGVGSRVFGGHSTPGEDKGKLPPIKGASAAGASEKLTRGLRNELPPLYSSGDIVKGTEKKRPGSHGQLPIGGHRNTLMDAPSLLDDPPKRKGPSLARKTSQSDGAIKTKPKTSGAAKPRRQLPD
mmetsp:Transcript_53329/g.126898  ORF Transcript_53329/g.126898 Transcript_53329/m.126898 type:complete len:283 (+) Transcript_53329:57-905(+)